MAGSYLQTNRSVTNQYHRCPARPTLKTWLVTPHPHPPDFFSLSQIGLQHPVCMWRETLKTWLVTPHPHPPDFFSLSQIGLQHPVVCGERGTVRVNCIALKHNITFITCHSHCTNQDLLMQNLSLVQLCYYSSNTFKEITVKYLINAHFVWCSVSKQQFDCGGRSREGHSPFLISNMRPKGQGTQMCF